MGADTRDGYKRRPVPRSAELGARGETPRAASGWDRRGIMANGKALERLDAGAFEGDRLRRPGTWAIAFLADWCPFCRAFAPKFQALEGGGDFQVAEGDVTDQNSPLWDVFHLDVVPTVIVFRNGAPTFRQNGRLMRGLSDKDLTALRGNLAGT